MTVRETTEAVERQTLAPRAALSQNSRGRRRPEEPCGLRPVYQRDILHTKAFRRLKQKTQVFLSPEGDHYRTRLTHTLEVSQIARTIARALRLNEDLTEAIALGHDLGHTPFGHAGERALDKLSPWGFEHYRQSLRVVDKLEKDGQGLNLTWEVRNGILTHTKGAWPATLEGQAVRHAAGILRPGALPAEAVALLGADKSARITTLITDLVAHNAKAVQAAGTQPAALTFSPEVQEAFGLLRDFMYATVYVDEVAKKEEGKVEKMIGELYERFVAQPELMPNFYLRIAYQEGTDRAVTDYISGMSDEFAVRTFERLFVPQRWRAPVPERGNMA